MTILFQHIRASRLNTLRANSFIVQEIMLAPLVREDLEWLIADSLHCESEQATPLARLIHEKTPGLQ
jgi:predicted ATPase